MMRFAMVGGVVLHYRLSGVGDRVPVVFINSLGTDARIWDAVIANLGGQYRIVQYDKRGHGLSDAPIGPYSIGDHVDDLLGLLDHLEISRAVLVGISVGGMIALELASRHPERVAGLIACDTGLKIGTRESWNARIEALRDGGLEGVADALVARWFSPAFLSSQALAVRGYRTMLSRQPLEGYVATCAALREADLHESATSIRAPALVICGSQDQSTPPELSRELAAKLGAPLELIEGAGHLPCLEQPELMAKHIARFLGGSNG